jgi:alkylation response protein AidB-like acyl-CoA dehydrogenase
LAALGALGVAAQLVGLAQGLLDQAVDYAKQREQFGKPIGTFQSVKHALADVYVDLAFARPVVLHAAATADLQGPSAARDASHAKLAATKAARHAARAALQVHGAIGYTFEHELHMWLKRLWTLTPLWGTEAEHREILARPAPTR